MIGLRDVTTLAYTKLRTRKLRLVITTVISALLFTTLATASLVGRGAFRSIEQFSQDGFGKRYIVSASPGLAEGAGQDNPDLIARAKALQTDVVARKKAEAKKLTISYDEKSEPPVTTEYDTPNGKLVTLNSQSSVARQALKEYLNSHPIADQAALQKLAAAYQPKAFYQSQVQSSYGDNRQGNLQLLKDGKEIYDAKTNPSDLSRLRNPGTATFDSGWQLMSRDLLKPFALPGQNLEASASGSLPVLAPYSAVEQLLKLSPLPPTASSQARLARLKEVRQKAASITFNVCYRNSASTELMDQAITAQKDITANKDNKNYQPPNLVYDLPAAACGAPQITRDTRTKDQKATAAREEQFQRSFGQPAPESKIIGLYVAGITTDIPGPNASAASQILRDVLGSSVGSGWYTPLELKDSNPVTQAMFADQDLTASTQYFVELSDAATTKRFLETENCAQFDAPMNTGVSGTMARSTCSKAGKSFNLGTFGSSSLALDSLNKVFSKTFRIITLGVAALASLIMIATVGRIIADSRRETAVFRAIGAKRLDIAQIYFTYTLFLSVLISLLTVAVAGVFTYLINASWSPKVTIDALVIYNSSDLSRKFTFFAIYPKDFAYLLGLIILAGLISASLPLLTNLRRSPIKDMRDER